MHLDLGCSSRSTGVATYSVQVMNSQRRSSYFHSHVLVVRLTQITHRKGFSILGAGKGNQNSTADGAQNGIS